MASKGTKSTQRKLTAILCADVVGSSRLLGGLLIVKVRYHLNQGLAAVGGELSPQLGQVLLPPGHTDHRSANGHISTHDA